MNLEQIPTNCDAHFVTSNFQTHSSGNFLYDLKNNEYGIIKKGVSCKIKVCIVSVI